MDLSITLLVVRDFMKSANVMPNGPKLFLLALLVVAGSLCYIAGKALDNASAILHEAPSAIRALREQQVKPMPEKNTDSARGQVNR
jgi:hypothetical protein